MNNYDYDYEDEKDSSHWDKPKPKHINSGFHGTSGSIGSFQCPDCGSYNTVQSTYAEVCNSCGWGQGY